MSQTLSLASRRAGARKPETCGPMAGRLRRWKRERRSFGLQFQFQDLNQRGLKQPRLGAA